MTDKKAEVAVVETTTQKRVALLAKFDVEPPAQLAGIIDVRAWAESLVTRVAYAEPNPDFLSMMLMAQTLMAETAEDVLAQSSIRKLQEAIPNVPGAGTGPIEINDLYVTSSDFGEGAPCYVILTAMDLETGVVDKYTTGAQQLQSQILRLLSLGVWPIRCQIKRTERKDKGGRFLFWLFPPD